MSEKREREQARLFEFEKRRIDADLEARVRTRQPELEAGVNEAPSPRQTAQFEVSKNIAVVPPFREAEVNSYFFALERVAAALLAKGCLASSPAMQAVRKGPGGSSCALPGRQLAVRHS